MENSEGCKKIFACHSCIESLKAFIESAEQAEKLHQMQYIEIAFKELTSAKQMARVIVYSGENEGG